MENIQLGERELISMHKGPIRTRQGEVAQVVNPIPVFDRYTLPEYHEAVHAVAIVLNNPANIGYVSIIPGPGYGGVTTFKKFDPVATAAPYALGYTEGTQSDLNQIVGEGYDVRRASEAARNLLRGKMVAVHGVAAALGIKKVLSGHEVRTIVQQALNPVIEVKNIKTGKRRRVKKVKLTETIH